MVDKLDSKRAALSLGILFAIVHTLGVLLIRTPILSYWEWSHMMRMNLEIGAFSIVTLIAGLIVAGVVGGIVGWLFAAIYNSLGKR